MITLTESATRHVRQMMAGQDNSAKYLRCGVKSGGCSGMEYVLEFEAEKKQTDRLFESNGLEIICNTEIEHLLDGLTVDYKDALVGGGLQFSNPNAARSCGCGTSFNVTSELRSL